MDSTDFQGVLETLSSNKRILAEERLIVEAAERIYEMLKLENISKSELAKRLGVSRASVTNMLSGRQNLTMRTFAALANELGCDASVRLIPRERVGLWQSYDDVVIKPLKIYRPESEMAANDEWTRPQRLTVVGLSQHG